MTQEANKNEKSKVPFLEDALDSLDKTQTSSPESDENLTGDNSPTFEDEKSNQVAFDDDAILLDSLSIDDEIKTDSVTMTGEVEYPSLDTDDLSFPSENNEGASVALPAEDEDSLDSDEFDLPAESDSSELPVEDEDVLDVSADELGLPVESDSLDLTVEDEDVLDVGVDELGLPVESDSLDLTVEDEDVLDVGVDELGLPIESDNSELPVEDEDVLDVGVDELGLPVESDDSELPVEDEDELDAGVDELGLPVDEEESDVIDSSTDDLDLVMGTAPSDENEEFDVPIADDETDQSNEEDLDGGLDLLMGGDDQEDEYEPAPEDEPKPAPEDDFDLMMNSDDEADEDDDPISNWEKNDDEDDEDDELGDDDEDLLNGFLPGDDEQNDPTPHDEEYEFENVDSGVADMLDNFAPAMSKDEDVDDFLNEIESKGESAPPAGVDDFLPDVEREDAVEDNAKTEAEITKDTKSEKTEKPSEEKESDDHTDKPGIVRKLSRVFAAVAIAGGVIFSSLYINENGVPKEVSSLMPDFTSSSENAKSESSVLKEIKTLRKEVELLSGEVKKVKSSSEYSLKEYKRLVELQAELNKSYAAQMDTINSIKSSAKKYEGEMITRLEKLALYVKSVESGNNKQQSIMRESLYKELVAYIKANASNDDAGKLTELTENLRKQSVKTAQLDAALQAQRRVVSIIEDEQDYLRGTVDSIRKTESSPSVNLLKSDNGDSGLKKDTDESAKAENSEEACCVFVEEKKVAKTLYSNAKKEDSELGYRLVSVIKRGPRSWDVFLEPKIGKGRMSVEKYTLTPMGSSVVPGYGRIKDVVELKGGDARIPYKVITENGTLVSRKKG